MNIAGYLVEVVAAREHLRGGDLELELGRQDGNRFGLFAASRFARVREQTIAHQYHATQAYRPGGKDSRNDRGRLQKLS